MSAKEKNCCKKTSIGGQALMEGIMMRGPEKTAMAVRNAAGEIVLETVPMNAAPSKASKIPFVRGIVNMLSSLKLGYQCLMRSADIMIADAEKADAEAKAKKEAEKAAKAASEEIAPGEGVPDESTLEESAAENPAPLTEETVAADETASAEETAAADETASAEESAVTEEGASEAAAKKTAPEKAKKGSATTAIGIISGILAVALAVGLFIVLPAYLYKGFAHLVGINPDSRVYGWSLLRSAFEGVIKIVLLVAYMALISLMKDIHRVFMYHGAEHKTIFCYEHGLPLTVENVRTQRRLHPRCGTSFIILVLLVSIVLGFFIPAFLATWLRVLIKIALIPLVVGIGYELIKLAGRKDNLLTKIISAPGMWLQKITTKEPDDSMIECAIAAMNEVIPDDPDKDRW